MFSYYSTPFSFFLYAPIIYSFVHSSPSLTVHSFLYIFFQHNRKADIKEIKQETNIIYNIQIKQTATRKREIR